MTGAGFAARHPVLWHVSEAEGLAGILAHGLLPAAELMRRAGRGSADNRERFVPVGTDPPALLRPQLMRDATLLPSLAGRFAGDPAAWRAHIDAHAFLWANAVRRDAFLAACRRARRRWEPGAPEPVLLALRTAPLLEALGAAVVWSPVNSGSTLRSGARIRRDEGLLRPVADWPGRGRAAEVAVRGGIPPGNLPDLIVAVTLR